MKQLKALIDRLLNKKAKFDLDGDGKIESYRQEVEGLFSQFKKISDTIDEVNGKYNAVIEEEKAKQVEEQERLERLLKTHEEKMKKSASVVEKAEAEIQVNTKAQEKVKEFIF